jgi:hypothetical protein
MNPALTFASSVNPVALLSTLTPGELVAADRRYPKWVTMCQLRRIGLAVLDAVLLIPGQDHQALDAAIAALAAATGQDRLMVRSDGGAESRRYYKGGNTFLLAQAASKAAGLLEAGRAVILMEPTNRFTNRLTALIRMDRPALGREETFTIEGLGPGYDVADLTRGGIRPQVVITTEADWSHYREPWWSDLRLTTDITPEAEHQRRQQRLIRLAADVLTDTGHLTTDLDPQQQAADAETWLRQHDYDLLWRPHDVARALARRARRWFDDAFMIAACHPRHGWTCLATATSETGGRWVFWDIVDGQHKYAARSAA